MTAHTQEEMDAVVNQAEGSAGFLTTAVDKAEAGNERAARRRREQEAASDAPQFIVPTMGDTSGMSGLLSDGRTEPTLEQVEPAVAVEAPTTDTAPVALRVYLQDCWNQDAIDETAYNAVKHLEIYAEPNEHSPLKLYDPRSKDVVELGTHLDTGTQAILGKGNITPAQALNRARLAMTSDLMRTQGIDQVHGNEMDQALLMLAAEDVGLKINNLPVIAPAVMQEARQQWATMIALAAVGAGASAEEAMALAEVLTPDAPGSGPDINLADVDFDDQPVTAAQPAATDDFAETVPMAYGDEAPAVEAAPDDFPATQAMVYEGEAAVPGIHAVTVAAAETPDPAAVAAATVVEPPVVPVVEALESTETIEPQEFVTAVEVSPAPVQVVPASAPPAGVVPQLLTETVILPEDKEQKVAALRDEVKKVLAGRRATETVNPEIYVELVEQLKAGNKRFADDQGFLNLKSITQEFQERGIGTGKTRRLVEALKADNLVTDAVQTATAPRTVVNYQVPSPVLHPPRIMPQ